MDRERADLIQLLHKHRGFLRQTVEGMSDEQIRNHPTVSELCLGGIIKHVTATEATWRDFMGVGDQAFAQASAEAYAAEWVVGPDDTVESLLAAYAAGAALTDAVVAEIDLDSEHPLPDAPWFPPGEAWSARRCAVHIIAETAQHAGHADIIRESIDGAKTMG